MTERRKRNKRKQSTLLLICVFLVLTVVPAALFFINSDFYSHGETENNIEAQETVNEENHFDIRAEKIKKPFFSKDEKNKEGDFSYEMNKSITFKGDVQEGKIELVNPHRNNYLMYLELSLKSNDEVFFRSGLLRPGEKISKITLEENLPQGNYDATAVISAVDPVTEEFLGFLTHDIKIKAK